MSMSMADLGAARRKGTASPPGQVISNPAFNRSATTMGDAATSSVGPAIAWGACVGLLFAIRVLWHMGGRPGGNIIPGGD